MSLEVEATYHDGVLQLDAPLPFVENARVKVTVQKSTESVVDRTYGMFGWTGDPEILRKIAEDDIEEEDIEEEDEHEAPEST